MKSNNVTNEELDALLSVWWKGIGEDFYKVKIKDFNLLDDEEIAKRLERFKSIQVVFVRNKLINFIVE